jgi:uncharacterized protein (TIGR03067 family)
MLKGYGRREQRQQPAARGLKRSRPYLPSRKRRLSYSEGRAASWRTPMYTRIALLPALFLFGGGAADDVRKLQGSWQVLAAEDDGEVVPEDDLKALRVVFTGDSVEVQEGRKAQKKFTFKLDPKKSPKAIDFTYSDGPKKGMTDRGIYLLEADHLKLCIRTKDGDRPTTFASKEGSQVFLIVLRRLKE